MKILVLGGDGMLGHQLLSTLQQRHKIRVTLHQKSSVYRAYKLFNNTNSYYGVDVRNTNQLSHIMDEFRPDAVINAIGIVKQRTVAKDAIPNIEINALLPHQLALLCAEFQARLVHISTDCVFSGKRGSYTEKDFSDAEDLYGKTKYLGEVWSESAITLRTSFIGLELSRKTSLLEWFMAQKGCIKGYRKAIYTGVTTVEMSHIIETLLLKHPQLSGVWHVASEPISKYDLLTKLANLLGRNDIEIAVDDKFLCDRSLIGDAFYQVTGYKIPSWDRMLENLVNQINQRNELTVTRELECTA